MTLFDRIYLTSTEKGLSISELEKRLGFGNKTIYRWKTTSPSVDRVLLVANLLQVSLNWLVTGEDDMKSITIDDSFMTDFNQLEDIDQQRIKYYIDICLATSKSSNKNVLIVQDKKYKYYEEPAYNTIPILGYVAAGTPIEGINLPMGYLHTKLNADYALVAKGESMEPVIKDQEYIFVRKTSVLDSGDIGIFYINGEVTCKEFHKTDSELVLKSLNSSFKPFKFSLNSLENSMIQGKVILSDEQKARLENF